MRCLAKAIHVMNYSYYIPRERRLAHISDLYDLTFTLLPLLGTKLLDARVRYFYMSACAVLNRSMRLILHVCCHNHTLSFVTRTRLCLLLPSTPSRRSVISLLCGSTRRSVETF
jgi:hypothetical protein